MYYKHLIVHACDWTSNRTELYANCWKPQKLQRYADGFPKRSLYTTESGERIQRPMYCYSSDNINIEDLPPASGSKEYNDKVKMCEKISTPVETYFSLTKNERAFVNMVKNIFHIISGNPEHDELGQLENTELERGRIQSALRPTAVFYHKADHKLICKCVDSNPDVISVQGSDQVIPTPHIHLVWIDDDQTNNSDIWKFMNFACLHADVFVYAHLTVDMLMVDSTERRHIRMMSGIERYINGTLFSKNIMECMSVLYNKLNLLVINNNALLKYLRLHGSRGFYNPVLKFVHIREEHEDLLERKPSTQIDVDCFKKEERYLIELKSFKKIPFGLNDAASFVQWCDWEGVIMRDNSYN